MALINCPECSQQMSDSAKRCPHCGHRLTNFDWKNTIIGGGIVFIGLIITILSFPIMSNWSTGEIVYTYDEFLIGCIMFVVGLASMFIGFRILKKGFRFSMLTFGILAIASIVSLVIMFMVLGLTPCRRYYDRNQIETPIIERVSQKARNGWGYFIDNVRDKQTRLLQVQEQLDDISSVVGIANTSIVLYTVEDSNEEYLVWVFFKGETPKHIALTKLGEYLTESQINTAKILLID